LGVRFGRAARASWRHGIHGHLGLTAIFCLMIAAPARAEDDSGETPIEIHGFISQGAIKTTDNNYLADSEDGSLEFSEAGLNFTKSLSDRLRVGIQLFARDLGPIGDYKPQLDWYYLDYRFADWFGVRAGRTKLPIGLYNETSDIDAARVPVLLPQSIYPTQSRDYFLAQTGAELYGFVPLGGAGALDYRLYGGTIFVDIPGYSAAGATAVAIPYLYGSRLLWQTPLSGFQIGLSAQRLRFDLHYTPSRDALAAFPMPLPPDFKGTIDAEIPVTIGVASLEYQGKNLLVAAEYIRQWLSVKSSFPAVIPETEQTREGYYLMASYHVASWFTPGLYYSVMFPDVKDRHGREAYQRDLAISFRWDLTQHWLLKFESHYMSGTAGLNPALNDNKDRSELDPEWGAFFLKTTAYF
jgi:hypothetical protein